MRVLAILCLLLALLGSTTSSPAALAEPQLVLSEDQPALMTELIVQGASSDALTTLVESHGGQVTRDLGVIGAVAARVPTDRVAALARDPGVKGVWQDAAVRSSDSADPGTTYAPVAGGASERAGFDLHKVTALDGDKENLDDLPKNTISPYVFQSYTFKVPLDPESMLERVALRFVFKEKELNQARLEVLQASTGAWHAFEIDTGVSDDQWIDVTLDLSAVLATAEDLAEVQVRFYASEVGGGKAEVDYVALIVQSVRESLPWYCTPYPDYCQKLIAEGQLTVKRVVSEGVCQFGGEL